MAHGGPATPEAAKVLVVDPAAPAPRALGLSASGLACNSLQLCRFLSPAGHGPSYRIVDTDDSTGRS